MRLDGCYSVERDTSRLTLARAAATWSIEGLVYALVAAKDPKPFGAALAVLEPITTIHKYFGALSCRQNSKSRGRQCSHSVLTGNVNLATRSLN
jgi:hypothetical protein